MITSVIELLKINIKILIIIIQSKTLKPVKRRCVFSIQSHSEKALPLSPTFHALIAAVPSRGRPFTASEKADRSFLLLYEATLHMNLEL